MSEGQKAGPYIQEHPGHVLPPAPGWYVMRYRPYSGGVVWTKGIYLGMENGWAIGCAPEAWYSLEYHGASVKEAPDTTYEPDVESADIRDRARRIDGEQVDDESQPSA